MSCGAVACIESTAWLYLARLCRIFVLQISSFGKKFYHMLCFRCSTPQVHHTELCLVGVTKSILKLYGF